MIKTMILGLMAIVMLSIALVQSNTLLAQDASPTQTPEGAPNTGFGFMSIK